MFQVPPRRARVLPSRVPPRPGRAHREWLGAASRRPHGPWSRLRLAPHVRPLQRCHGLRPRWSRGSRRRGPGSARLQSLQYRSFEPDAPRSWRLVRNADEGRVLDGVKGRLSPLDERYGFGFQVIVELEHVAVFDPLQAVEVQVVDDQAPPVLEPLVTAGQLVGWARHPVLDAERADGCPHEGGLAGADLTGEHHYVAGREY